MKVTSLKAGLSFGLTSAVITTLGLIVGLASSTQSKIAVVGAIFTIAVADAFSDAMGMYASEETEEGIKLNDKWLGALGTFIGKLLFALSFVLPVWFFDLSVSVWLCAIWGLTVLSGWNAWLAQRQGRSAARAVIFHLVGGLLVVTASYWIGNWIAHQFN